MTVIVGRLVSCCAAAARPCATNRAPSRVSAPKWAINHPLGPLGNRPVACWCWPLASGQLMVLASRPSRAIGEWPTTAPTSSPLLPWLGYPSRTNDRYLTVGIRWGPARRTRAQVPADPTRARARSKSFSAEQRVQVVAQDATRDPRVALADLGAVLISQGPQLAVDLTLAPSCLDDAYSSSSTARKDHAGAVVGHEVEGHDVVDSLAHLVRRCRHELLAIMSSSVQWSWVAGSGPSSSPRVTRAGSSDRRGRCPAPPSNCALGHRRTPGRCSTWRGR